MNRKLHVVACFALCLTVGRPVVLRAQTGPTLDVTGLLRTGFRLESSATGGRDGFALYDARIGATGKVGIVFDYVAGIEVDRREESIRLLDAALGFAIKDDLLRLGIGLERSRFGGEASAWRKRNSRAIERLRPLAGWIASAPCSGGWRRPGSMRQRSVGAGPGSRSSMAYRPPRPGPIWQRCTRSRPGLSPTPRRYWRPLPAPPGATLRSRRTPGIRTTRSQPACPCRSDRCSTSRRRRR